MIRRKKKSKLPELTQPIIIEHEGRRYYKLNRDEIIQKDALHKHVHGKKFNPILHEKTVGKRPCDFIQRNFYNPLPETNIKKGKFRIEDIYIDYRESY